MRNKTILSALLLGLVFNTACGQTIKSLKSVGIDQVTIIEIANLGDIWVGTGDSGIYHYSAGGSLETHISKASFPLLSSDTINAIAVGPVHQTPSAFFGTPSGLSFTEGLSVNAIAGLPANATKVTALALDSNSNLYVFSATGGGCVFDSNQTFKNNLGLPFSHITCVAGPMSNACDSPGLTVGSLDSGACYTTDYVTYTPMSGLVSDSVTAVYRIRGCNARVIGTRHGFSFCPDGHPYQNYDTLPDNYITAISQDCSGNVWLGTRSAGIEVFNPMNQTFRRITTANGLSTDSITTLAAATVNGSGCNNSTFVGTNDGSVVTVDSTFNVTRIINGVQNESTTAEVVRIFPQPASNQVNFLFTHSLKNAQFCFTDINGRVLGLYDLNNTDNFTLNVSTLATGLYIYKVYNDSTVYKAGKFEVVK